MIFRSLSCLFVALLLALPASAALTDRTPLAEPRSTLPAAGPGRVVASDNGLFLVHGQRISPDGVRIDQEPVPGTEGYAVAWPGGWVILHSGVAYFLGEEGPPEELQQIFVPGRFLGAASNGGKLAILELNEGSRPFWIYLSVFDENGLVQRRPLAALDGGAIAPFGDGFLAITHVRTSDEASVLHAWLIDRNGTPTAFQDLGLVGPQLRGVEIAVGGERALVTTYDSREITARVIDASLLSSTPHVISDGFFNTAFPLALETGFLFSYQRGPFSEARAVTLDFEGKVETDTVAEPIVGGDRIGARYLVMRPWGHAGIADEDPRRIIAALPLQQRIYRTTNIRETIVSGEITLVVFGDTGSERFWTRFDADGEPIDSDPQAFQDREEVVALPHGFGFFTVQAGGIAMRRLSQNGGWIDAEPMLVARSAPIWSFTAHANERDLVVAWTTENEFSWSRFEHDGTAMQAEPFRLARRQRVYIDIHLAGNDIERLLLVHHVNQCNILCPPVDDRFEAMAIDAEGDPIGELQTLDVSQLGVMAVQLPDRTWVVPSGSGSGQLVHLAPDASLIEEVRNPMLRDIRDIEPTAAGWRATADAPSRLIEVHGFNSPVRVTGLGETATPHLGFGEWLAFAAESPGPESTNVPWNGRLSTTEGDLSIEARETRDPSGQRRLRIAVTNRGTGVATNVRITSVSASPSVRTIPSIAPRGVVYIVLPHPGDSPVPHFFVLSEDIEDINPSDNVSPVGPAAPPQTRRRGAARGD